MGILKFRLNRKNSSGSYDTIHYESSSNIILRPNSTTVENSLISLETSYTSLNSEMTSLKTSVSNGKAQIASAITGKGVSTSSSASFSTMANNIKKLNTVSGSTYLFKVFNKSTTFDGNVYCSDIFGSKYTTFYFVALACVDGNRNGARLIWYEGVEYGLSGDSILEFTNAAVSSDGSYIYINPDYGYGVQGYVVVKA